ncbi:MAG: hypothetical protein K0R08_2238 [Solimicrobium sp.]|jgi:hypothetical protein|nr:hypothetical protein [Solimicrobium sp.]
MIQSDSWRRFANAWTGWHVDPDNAKDAHRKHWRKVWKETQNGENVIMEGSWLWENYLDENERDIATTATNLTGTWPNYSGLGYKKIDVK